MNQAQRNEGQGKVVAMRKPVQRVSCRESLVVREGSTGSVVPVRLHRVWAVAEVGAVVEPTHDDGAVMKGAPRVLRSRCRGPQPKVEVVRAEPEMERRAPEMELAFYRKYTEALLRRYMRMSMSAGRVPSLMGREMFRGHVTHYRAHTFEDVAIFCFDIERQLERLTAQEKELVKRIALQQYTQMEVAGMLGVTLRHCVRLYGGTLDRLTGLFLSAKLLQSQTLAPSQTLSRG